MEEIWKDIEGFEEAYQVSNFGRVRSKDRVVVTERYKNRHERGKVLKLRKDKDGYCIFNAKWCGLNRLLKVHREVARCFIANPQNYPCIDHIDCNRTNNKVDNLRWVTYKENANNPITRINLSKALIKVCESEENRRKKRAAAKMQKNIEARRNKIIKPIIQFDKNGIFISEFSSVTEAAQSVNWNVTNITRNCKGKKPSAYGYIWKYKEVKK
jgi:hypothetical protein